MTDPTTAKRYTLPEGYRTRPARLEDAQAVADVWFALSSAMGVPERLEASDYIQDWQAPKFNLEDSTLIVEDTAGAVIGFAEVWDVSDPPIHPDITQMVHPDHAHKGIEQYLMQWGEARALRVIPRCPATARIAYHSGTLAGYEYGENLLREMGYQNIRYWLRMVIDMDEAPPEATLAEGYSIRTVRFPDELEKMAQAVDDAFKDHWGHVDRPLEQMVERWQHRIESDEKFDDTLFFIAVDDATGDFAGMSLCRIEEWGRPEAAYVATLGVLRDHRKRGLAQALLYHTFGEFWRRGRKTVSLHVDATSLTGATKLYEKVGMYADDRWGTWEKLLRDGTELATTSVEE